MAGFINLSEAAAALGLSEDAVRELTSSGELRGFRDGPSWKFKQDEVDRYKEVMASGGSGIIDAAGSGIGGLDEGSDALSLEDDDLLDLASEADDADGSSILVSEEALGKSEETTSSTVIGASGAPVSEDGDLQLATGEEVASIDPDSDLSLADVSDDSDIKVVPGGSDVLSGSESELSLATGSGTGDIAEDTGDDDLSIGSDALDLDEDLELALADDDGDLVLGGSGTGSDVSLGTDSGINLASPSDSGLSLEEEPLELAGSSLELPEDDDFIDLESEADPDEATQLKQDEEFLLSPSDELGGFDADESDSGSQVIALEDSEAFDQDAATMIAGAGGAGLAAAGAGLEGQVAYEDHAQAPAHAPAPASAAPVYVPAELPEAPYTIFQILGLMMILGVLSITGIIMTDVVRNMWSWNGDPTSAPLTDAIISMLGI